MTNWMVMVAPLPFDYSDTRRMPTASAVRDVKIGLIDQSAGDGVLSTIQVMEIGNRSTRHALVAWSFFRLLARHSADSVRDIRGETTQLGFPVSFVADRVFATQPAG